MMLKNIFWLSLKNSQYYAGFFAVIFAGTLWSFGAVVVRYMESSHQYQIQYLFYRGLSIGLILCFYLFLKEGVLFYKNFLKIGVSGIIGAIFLAIAMLTFILSITKTTAAITLLMLAMMPFMTAILGLIFIKEKIRPITFFSMLVALVGVSFMVQLDSTANANAFVGLLLGMASAFGFSIFTITLRLHPETPKFTTVSLAGFFCAIVSILFVLFTENQLKMPMININLSVLHGTIVATGLIFYSIGAKYLPAAEVTLLSLMEVVGGIFWVWLPAFGIHETPSNNTIIGGFIVILAVLIHAVGAKRKYIPSLQ